MSSNKTPVSQNMSSSDNTSATHEHVAREKNESSMVAKLAEELDDVLDLRNTEDVDRDTTYAPGKPCDLHSLCRTDMADDWFSQP
jgi:hypothetical protein